MPAACLCTNKIQTAAIYIPKQRKSQGYPAAIKWHWILNDKRGAVAWAIGFWPISSVLLHCSNLSSLFIFPTIFPLQYSQLSHLSCCQSPLSLTPLGIVLPCFWLLPMPSRFSHGIASAFSRVPCLACCCEGHGSWCGLLRAVCALHSWVSCV